MNTKDRFQNKNFLAQALQRLPGLALMLLLQSGLVVQQQGSPPPPEGNFEAGSN